MPTVTEQLRKAIEKSPLSRYAICKATGIDQSRMSKFMAGGKLTMEQCDSVCEVLKLKLSPKGK